MWRCYQGAHLFLIIRRCILEVIRQHPFPIIRWCIKSRCCGWVFRVVHYTSWGCSAGESKCQIGKNNLQFLEFFLNASVLPIFLSGSHFNPALTVSVYLCGGIRLNMVGPYIVSQLIGGILGAGISKVCSQLRTQQCTTICFPSI